MKAINLELLNGAINKSGIRQEELADLFSVSRQTVYNWRKGQRSLSNLIVDRAEKLCKAIIEACDAGRLPVPEGTEPSDRMTLIKSAMLNK